MTGDRAVRGVFNPDYRLSNYNLIGNELHAMELLTRKGKEMIKAFYINNPNFTDDHPECLLKSVTYMSDKASMLANLNKAQPSAATPPAGKQINGPSPAMHSATSNSSQYTEMGLGANMKQLDKYTVFNSGSMFTRRFAELEAKKLLPSEIFVVAYHRRFIKKTDPLFFEYVPQLIGTPLILNMPAQPSGRRIYDEVWALAHVLIKPNSKIHRPNSRWWERRDWTSFIQKKS